MCAFFMQDKYYYPTSCKGKKTTDQNNNDIYQLLVTCGSTTFYFELSEKF